MVLTIASPALALSLGVSPTHVELEVTGNDSTVVNVNIHYFDGDVEISLVDIPLRVEPSIIHVEALDEPVVVELTIYGNNSLGSQVYDGYIRFIAVSGGAATGGVQIIAKVTNMTDVIAMLEEPAIEEPVVLEESVVDEPAAVETTTVLEPTAGETIATASDKPWLIPVVAGGCGLILILIIIFTVTQKKELIA